MADISISRPRFGRLRVSNRWLSRNDAVNADDDSSSRRRRKLGPGRPIPYGAALGPALLLVLWLVGSATGYIDDRILSAPWTVATTGLELVQDGRLQENLWTSFVRSFWGLFWGIVAGASLGVIAGLSRVGEYLVDGPIQIKRAIPALALIPLLMLWFGIGEGMKILTIALITFAPIYIQTHDGLRSTDARFIELAETLDLTHAQFLRHVVLPAALPGFLLGLRFGVTYSWLALVVVEQVNATSGLGYMINLARTYGQTEVIILCLAVYAALGLSSDWLVRLITRKALPWRKILAD
ncbi:ABC transporter permease [Bosea sp. F3-2]|uniref:ABC transporter permease n=1 Tax=Bosea sp. F3-2 TaxID=2599640 RepID=UPI0011ED3534|nr:ABC transporter permease [Bosea sp. F3-2]QEL22474.1 ABC transporter permease [Bosea sp. F3-2]